MTFEDINLLIISALYSKAMALFKTQAEPAVRVSCVELGQRQASPLGLLRLREKSQLTEEAFSDELTIFLSNGDYQDA